MSSIGEIGSSAGGTGAVWCHVDGDRNVGAEDLADNLPGHCDEAAWCVEPNDQELRVMATGSFQCLAEMLLCPDRNRPINID